MKKIDSLSLLSWFQEFGRNLPWRNSPTPYHVWLSEVMLQQTRVEAVKNYYERFLSVLPDIPSLSSCEEDVYLKLWQGLGYYSRVRNLHFGACQIMEKHQGKIPGDYDQLIKIKGIGEYTAKAILSIAYQKPYVAVDGNLLRVFARLNSYDHDIKSNDAKKECNDFFAPFLGNRPGDFNQALMDLGELICLPHGQPKCELCPFEKTCLAHQKGKEQDYPIIINKTKKKEVFKTVFVIHCQEEYLIQKRPDKGLLASLYEFINIDMPLTKEEATKHLTQEGYSVSNIEDLHRCQHTFTHLIWNMQGYDVELKTLPTLKDKQKMVKKEELENTYSIPSAFSYFLNYILLK